LNIHIDNNNNNHYHQNTKIPKSRLEKGGFPSHGIHLGLCENPLPPLDEAIEAAIREMPSSNHYTEPYSHNLKSHISNYIQISEENIHINAGSELILRQIFSRFGKKVHLLSPTYYLFEEIAETKTYTLLNEKENFNYDITKLEIPKATTLVAIINPNNPTGNKFNINENIQLIDRNPNTLFLIDEAFIEFVDGGGTAAEKSTAVNLVSEYKNVIVTRTFSKAFSLAGCRVGYAIANKELINYLDNINDAYPLSRSAEAAAIESLNHVDKINERVVHLKKTTKDLISSLKTLGIVSFPTETFFFLIKIPFENTDADEFANLLAEHNIHVRPLHLKGLENKYIRFATSTVNNNEIVISTIKEIIGKICI
jgi:histidinol-phosphate aminotransferase